MVEMVHGARFRILFLSICVSVLLSCNRSGAAVVTQRPAATQKAAQWRLGFAATRDVDLVEVLPKTDGVCDEASSLRKDIPDDRELYIVSSAKARTLEKSPQPSVWTVFRLDGSSAVRQLSSLAIMVKTDLNGCFYLAGGSGLQSIKQISLMTDQNLLVAIEGERKQGLAVRTAHDPATTPRVEGILDMPEFQSIQKPEKVVSGKSVEASFAGKAETVTVLNYGYPDLSDGGNRWGVFRTSEGRLVPEYISTVLTYNPKNINAAYRINLVAATDIDGDGWDELILEKSYYEGSNYLVLSHKNGVWVEAYESAVWR